MQGIGELSTRPKWRVQEQTRILVPGVRPTIINDKRSAAISRHLVNSQLPSLVLRLLIVPWFGCEEVHHYFFLPA